MTYSTVQVKQESGKARRAVSPRTRVQACVAILLMQANLAFAVQEPSQQQAPATQQPTAPPEAPAPPPNGQPAATPTLAQQMQQTQQQAVGPQRPFHVEMPRGHHNPLAAYRPSTAPELDLTNSPRLENLIRDGKLYISLNDAISLAIENNLDIAYFRYNFPIAQTDILRTKSGAFANGVNTGISQFSGIGASSGGGGGGGGAGSSAGAGGIVQSTLGQGTTVPSFDPFLTFKGYVDHTTTQEVNQFQVGTQTLKSNTIEGLANFSQSFPLGTNIFAQYQGERQTNNSPYSSINPTLYSSFAVEITQPFLAGFGTATNNGTSRSPSATPRSPTLRSSSR